MVQQKASSSDVKGANEEYENIFRSVGLLHSEKAECISAVFEDYIRYETDLGVDKSQIDELKYKKIEIDFISHGLRHKVMIQFQDKDLTRWGNAQLARFRVRGWGLVE